MRKNIVAGNWKMNKTLPEGIQLVKDILHQLEENNPSKSKEELVIVLGAPYIFLGTGFYLVKDNEQISIAAQNCYTEESGAYTGEVSAAMIKSTGAEYVIIGHSERRAYFNESNEMLAKKVDIALKHDLTPIFCCGELLEVRQANEHFNLVKQQIQEAVFHLSADDFSRIVIAYEPVWAIGTGVTASPEQAQEMHAFIRSTINEKYGNKVANNMTILYGGSCNAQNARELFANPDVDGGLIGGASLKANDFVQIVNSF